MISPQVQKKEYAKMEATRRTLEARTASVRISCTSALSPNWRVTLIGIASWLLYEAGMLSIPRTSTIDQQPAWLCFFASLFCFAAFWLATRPVMPVWLGHAMRTIPAICRGPLWRGLFLLWLVFTAKNILDTQLSDGLHGVYRTDAIAFVHSDADQLRQGHNPYTVDNAFWLAVSRWPTALATPLAGGKTFGNDPRRYPSGPRIATALRYGLMHPQTRAATHDFDPQTVHNYPAGIVWFALPLVWAGIPSLIWLNAIFFLLMIAIVMQRVPPTMRIPLVVVLLANPAILLFELFDNFDLCCLFFVVAAWHWLPRERTSALLMGIACAVKQVAWFIAPFYLLEILRREGWRAMIRRGAWMAVAFIVPNLPFLLASPGAWLHSLIIPMTDPMFPLGFGPITLALSGVIPLETPHTWMLLVIGLMVVLFAMQWFRPAILSDGLLFSLLPLWMSWRSSMNYLAVLPILASWLAFNHSMHTEPMEKGLAAEIPIPISKARPGQWRRAGITHDSPLPGRASPGLPPGPVRSSSQREGERKPEPTGVR